MKINSGQPLELGALPKKAKPASTKVNPVASANGTPSTVLNLSSGAKHIHQKLKHFDAHEEVREGVVEQAKAELEEWNGLSDNQIDDIFNKMIDEMTL